VPLHEGLCGDRLDLLESLDGGVVMLNRQTG
jgi:hypothetical protein